MTWRRGTVPALVVAGLAAYGWWVTGLRPFSGAALLAVLGAGLAAVAVGMAVAAGRARRGRLALAGPLADPLGRRARRAWPPGIGVWVVLALLLAGWELAAFFQHPRSEHPTLSLLLEDVLAARPVRAAAFAAWLAGTYRLARRR